MCGGVTRYTRPVPVPLVDVKAQYAPLLDDVKDRISAVLESGRFILGPNVEAFEREAADYIGSRESIGVANGSDALVLVLDALGIGRGDEVVCPAFTFVATAEAIARRGATPVFADLDRGTYNLDPERVADLVTPRTRAIIAVHLFGRPMSLQDLPSGIPVIEDAAQAFGARVGDVRVGSSGIASTFSFFPTKNLFGLGDGGLVTTSDPEIGDRIRMLRLHGSEDKRNFELIGYNSRLDELQAAVLRLFLEEVDGWNALRREAALRYADLGLGELCAIPDDESGHVYHMYVIRTPEQERLSGALAEAGIGHARYYTRPLHLQPVFSYLGHEEGDLPESERLAAENVALPLWAGIAPPQQEEVVDAIRANVPAGAKP